MVGYPCTLKRDARAVSTVASTFASFSPCGSSCSAAAFHAGFRLLQWPLESESESESEDETHNGQQVRTGGTETQWCAGGFRLAFYTVPRLQRAW